MPGTTRPHRARFLRWCLLGIFATLLVIALLLPNTGLAWLRDSHRWIGEPMNWLDDHSSPLIDLVHVAAFGSVAFVLACLWPRAAWWRIALPMLVLAAVSELLQFGVPGRTPLLGDVLDDAVGIAAGLLLAWPVRWCARRFA